MIVITQKTILFSIFLSLFCLATGCAGTGILVPAPSASGEEQQAVQSVKGVHVEVTGEGWGTDPVVYNEVTPLRVTIKNESESPLRITYGIFSLVDSRGNRYSVLPPYSIEEENNRMDSSAFTCPGFYVAPYYSPYYPFLRRYDDPFFYDQFYFQYYYPCWGDHTAGLPTKEMVDEALPEGVLWNKQSVSGFIYFERVSRSQGYRFRMSLIDIKTGAHFGEISIPLTVKKPQD
jgi:hypothetical protein